MFSFFASSSAIKKIRIIIARHYGGIYKRIDESRELLELLQTEAPEFLEAHPWVSGWIDCNDGFLTDIEQAIPVTQFPTM